MLYLAADIEAGDKWAQLWAWLWTPPAHEQWVIMFWTWIIMLVIVVFALIAQKDFAIIPRAWGAVFEHTYDWIADLATSMMGATGLAYVPFAMTLFLFVLVSNWIGLIPIPDLPIPLPFVGHFPAVESPTSNLNTTFALAVVSFLGFNFFGLYKHFERAQSGGHHHDHGHGSEATHSHPTVDPVTAAFNGFISWLGHYIQPTPTLWRELEGGMKLLVFPLGLLFIFLNIVEEWARLISLTMRLFGNIFGEHSVKGGLFMAMGMFGSNMAHALQGQTVQMGVAGNALLALFMWAITAFVTILGALAGFIQAFIFMVLSLSYIAHVVAEEH